MARRKQPVRGAEPDPNQIAMPSVQPVSLGERLQFQAGLPMQPRRATLRPTKTLCSRSPMEPRLLPRPKPRR